MEFADVDLVLKKTEQKKIDAGLAWPELSARYGESLLEAVEIRKAELEKIVKARAERGQKGKVFLELMERLDAAGAVKTQIIERLEVIHHERKSAIESK